MQLPGVEGWQKWGEVCKKMQTFSYKMNKI